MESDRTVTAELLLVTASLKMTCTLSATPDTSFSILQSPRCFNGNRKGSVKTYLPGAPPAASLPAEGLAYLS